MSVYEEPLLAGSQPEGQQRVIEDPLTSVKESQCLMSPSMLENLTDCLRTDDICVTTITCYLESVPGMSQENIDAVVSFMRNPELTNKQAAVRSRKSIPVLPGDRQKEIKHNLAQFILNTIDPSPGSKQGGTRDNQEDGKSQTQGGTSGEASEKSKSKKKKKRGNAESSSKRSSRSASPSTAGTPRGGSRKGSNAPWVVASASAKIKDKPKKGKRKEKGSETSSIADSSKLSEIDSVTTETTLIDSSDESSVKHQSTKSSDGRRSSMKSQRGRNDSEGSRGSKKRGSSRRSSVSSRKSHRRSSRSSKSTDFLSGQEEEEEEDDDEATSSEFGSSRTRKTSGRKSQPERIRYMTLDLSKPYADMPSEPVAPNMGAAAQEYFQTKEISRLFETMLASLVLEQPKRPLEYLIDLVRHMKKVQTTEATLIEVESQHAGTCNICTEDTRQNSRVASVVSIRNTRSFSLQNSGSNLPPVD